MATLHLSSKFGRDVLGIPMISRHLFCIGCNSLQGTLANHPILGVSGYNNYIVIPIFVGRFAFLHPLKNNINTISGWLSLLSVQNGNSNIGCLVAITPVAKTWKVHCK